jgi:hypothetical protein
LQETEQAKGDNELLDCIVERYKQILEEEGVLKSEEVLVNEAEEAQ